MEIVNKKNIERYLDNDWILAELQNINAKGSKVYTSDQWLVEDKAKRSYTTGCIVISERFPKTLNCSILVGGFLPSRIHSWGHLEYEIVDTCNHESNEDIGRAVKEHTKMKLSRSDWKEFQHSGTYDCVVANDIFPMLIKG